MRRAHRQIAQDMRRAVVLRSICKHAILLPEAENAYAYSKKYYPFRFSYPLETWLSVEEKARPPVVRPVVSPPFDHSLESFFLSYLMPVLEGVIKRHPFEPFFLNRKLTSDYRWTGEGEPRQRPALRAEVLGSEIALWDRFYQKFTFTQSSDTIRLAERRFFDREIFISRWQESLRSFRWQGGIKSLWVYPASHSDSTAIVSLNFDLTARNNDIFLRAIGAVCKAFKGLSFSLQAGTERTMIARVNGLSRTAVLDPWLLKHQGVCLQGDEGVRAFIIEPPLAVVQEKFRETLLYAFYSFLWRPAYPYAFYRLCFTFDRLCTHKELMFDQDALAGIYGKEFIREQEFDARRDTERLLSFLKERHGFDMFGR
jgi:hypothetical protein